jgi:hypothetical protein
MINHAGMSFVKVLWHHLGTKNIQKVISLMQIDLIDAARVGRWCMEEREDARSSSLPHRKNLPSLFHLPYQVNGVWLLKRAERGERF